MTQFYEHFEDHFISLAATDVLDFGDRYSRILKPDRATGTALDHLLKAFADILVGSGFARWRHVNYFTFECLFEWIERLIDKPVILETGSSAHGTNSSLLFAALAAFKGGSFDTVDLNSVTTERVRAALLGLHKNSPHIRCHNGDSVQFIEQYEGTANIVYLDSFDLNPDVFRESALHGLGEFNALLPKLNPEGSLILIDDTPRTREICRKMFPPEYLPAIDNYVETDGRLPGKGELVIEAIRKDKRFHILAWEYQLLLLYK